MTIKGFNDLIVENAFQIPDGRAIIPPNICETLTVALGRIRYKPGQQQDLLDSYQSIQFFIPGSELPTPTSYIALGLYARYQDSDHMAEGIRISFGGMEVGLNIYHVTKNMQTGATNIINQSFYMMQPYLDGGQWSKFELFFDPINGIGLLMPGFSVGGEFWNYSNQQLLRPGRNIVEWQQGRLNVESMKLDDWIVDEG